MDLFDPHLGHKMNNVPSKGQTNQIRHQQIKRTAVDSFSDNLNSRRRLLETTVSRNRNITVKRTHYTSDVDNSGFILIIAISDRENYSDKLSERC